MSYDQRCLDLAEAFLADHPNLLTGNRLDELAQYIQSTIENWIALEEAKPQLNFL